MKVFQRLMTVLTELELDVGEDGIPDGVELLVGDAVALVAQLKIDLDPLEAKGALS